MILLILQIHLRPHHITVWQAEKGVVYIMKKLFVKPEIEIINLNNGDVVCSSLGDDKANGFGETEEMDDGI